jgi:hypothetical protein
VSDFSFLSAHQTGVSIFIISASLVFLWAHIRGSADVWAAIAFSFLTSLIMILLGFEPNSLTVMLVLSVLMLNGIAMFVLLSLAMTKGGLAAWLSRHRGEKWIKELEYVYLALGALGVASTVNKLDFLDGRLKAGDIYAPMVLSLAIALRFLKTKAEIEGWNRIAQPTTPAPPASSPPPGTPAT